MDNNVRQHSSSLDTLECPILSPMRTPSAIRTRLFTCCPTFVADRTYFITLKRSSFENAETYLFVLVRWSGVRLEALSSFEQWGCAPYSSVTKLFDMGWREKGIQ